MEEIENQIKNPANMQMLEKIAKSIKRFELSEVMKKQQELFDISSI